MTFRSVLFSGPSRVAPFARPSRTLFFLLAGAFLLTLVPHAPQFPLWLSITVVGAIVIRCIIEVYRLPLPSTTFCGIVAIILLGAIFWQFNRITGREAGTAFTAGLLAIKFYELRRPRDVSLIIFSCFFVVMSALLYSQVLELFVYCLIMMWVLTALLLRVHTGDLPRDRLLRMLRGSGVVFLQSVPLALFLFFFLPRYTGKLGIPLDQASIGLTDTVKPGSIAALAKNDAEAMYVKFTAGAIPTPDVMYWRALVLWNYDNGTWTPGQLAGDALRTKPKSRGGSETAQEITIWPHNQRWLFALDTPVDPAVNSAEPSPWSSLMEGDVLQMNGGKLEQKARYTVVSSSSLAEVELSPHEKGAGTQLPMDQIDPRVTALADRLHQGLFPGQTEAYVQAVLDYFRSQHFVYSLDPGREGKDWLPVFLFRTRTGFCEHFASAFAVLMRLEHIPARLVVGYQGAQYNPYAGHYIVEQSDAHAWDEVWVDAKNQTAEGNLGYWMRVDPSVVFMATSGTDVASGSAGSQLALQTGQGKSSFAEDYLPGWMKQGLKDLQMRREQVESDWDNLVFSYDPEAQSRLAHALGFGEQGNFALVLGCVAAGGICILVFRRWLLRKTPISPVENLYAEFCRKMARRGIVRALWEGPLAYTQRLAEAFPDDKLPIQRVGSIVAHVRYGPASPDHSAPHDLKSLLNLLSASQAASSSRERR